MTTTASHNFDRLSDQAKQLLNARCDVIEDMRGWLVERIVEYALQIMEQENDDECPATAV